MGAACTETGGHNRADRRCDGAAAKLTGMFESFVWSRSDSVQESPPSHLHPLSAESRRPVNEAVLMCDIHLHEILMRAELLLSA